MPLSAGIALIPQPEGHKLDHMIQFLIPFLGGHEKSSLRIKIRYRLARRLGNHSINPQS